MLATITQSGVFNGEGEEIEVGTEITVKGDVLPAYLDGKAEPVKAAKAVTNPSKSKKRVALEKQAAKADVEFSPDTTDDDLIDAIKAAKAVTNPSKSKKRVALEKQAAKADVEFSPDTTDDDLIDAIKAAKAE